MSYINQLDGSFDGKIFVPSNIKNNKQTVIGKCDIRNIIFILIGLFINGTIFFIFKGMGNVGTGLALGLFCGTPFYLISFIKFKGLNIEDFILVFRSNNLSANSVRINNLDNVYENLLNKKEKVEVVEEKKDVKKKNFHKLINIILNKKEEVNNMVDTDDNIIKIQNSEKINKEKNKVSSLIYN